MSVPVFKRDRNMLISLVIPVYNVEPYIERCIHSVLKQTYKSLEVILVDDCTQDKSISLAKKTIAESCPEEMTFVFLKHERNRGLSAARNTGIEAATGEYVYFLDSDDEITPDCIEKLSKPLTQERYDFVIGDFQSPEETTHSPHIKISGAYYAVKEGFLHELWCQQAWNKLVDLAFLRDHRLLFKEGLIHEDELWSLQLACTATKMYAINETTYIYHIRPSSIMTSKADDEFRIRRMNVAEDMWQYLDNNGLSTDTVANHIIEQFIQSNHSIFVITPQMEGYSYYKRIRKMNHRNRRIYRHLAFSSPAGFIKYSHYLLPMPLGFAFKTLMRLIKRG